jgi:hypothetical protein
MAWLTDRWLELIDEFRLIEEWFSAGAGDQLAARYDTAISVLESGDVDAWMADAANAGIAEDKADHFRHHWLGGAMFPWVDNDRMITRMQDGFLAALTDGRELGLPLSIAWVAIDSTDPGFFDVGHVAGVNAVTVVIASPRPQPLELQA